MKMCYFWEIFVRFCRWDLFTENGHILLWQYLAICGTLSITKVWTTWFHTCNGVNVRSEIWVLVFQPWFVGQASYTNNTMVFSFHWKKNHFGAGAKYF